MTASQSLPLYVRELGCIAYEPVWAAMKEFTEARDANTADELWLLEHPSVFTQGQAGKAEHVLAPGDIPVVQVDRGGQVTYHGPGQLVGYVMFDVRRMGISVRELVRGVEAAIVAVLAEWGVTAAPDESAPGVYVNGNKIASLGLRVRRGCSFHGLSINLDMSLEPFARINPCGYAGLQVVQLRELSHYQHQQHAAQLKQQLVAAFCQQFTFSHAGTVNGLPAPSAVSESAR